MQNLKPCHVIRHGPPLAETPNRIVTEIEKIKAERVARFKDVDIYPVTCEELSNGRSDVDVLENVIEGGARIVQLRDKSLPVRALYEKAVVFREITQAHNVLLIMNDHIDIAMAINADGVHLGQDDFPVRAARQLIPDKIIGNSTHSLEDALRAAGEGADYINIGPIFPTQTKVGLSRFLGPEMIGVVAPRISLPFTVMGGITAGNIDQVLAAGARRIAVVTAITKAESIADVVRQLRERILVEETVY